MNSKFSRRRFLLAGGSMLAIPMLESLWPSKLLAAATVRPKLIAYEFPLGCVMNTWQPIVNGNQFSLPDQLSDLAPFKSDLIFPTSLSNYPNQQQGVLAAHCRPGTFMTNTSMAGPGSAPQLGTSIDQLIAQKLGIKLSPGIISFGAPGDGYPDTGYSALYQSNISWTTPTQPAGRITDTGQAFKAVFGQAPGGNGAPPALSAALSKSILDGALGEITSLQQTVSATDKALLDQYLTSLRQAEAQILQNPTAGTLACTSPNINGVGATDFPSFVDAMTDIIVLGMSCERIRIASFLMDYEFNSHYVTDYHSISHYLSADGYQARYQAISKWYASKYASLISKLKSTKDANGNPLLSSTIAVMGSTLHDANQHNSVQLPIIVAGQGGGLQTGRIVSTDARLASLWVSIANRMGASVQSFGENNDGALSGF
jgi:hypothetical protein